MKKNMTKKELNALNEVVEYSIDQERKDWIECGEPENHVYVHLRTLNCFLVKTFSARKAGC